MKTIITFFCFLTMFVAKAQWTTDTDVNTLVATSDALDMKAVGTSDGQTYIVNWKDVAAPTNIELRLQVLDADGNQTLGADGILVSDQVPMSTFTVLWDVKVDADDNLYIGVTGTGGGDPAYVFKLDTAGNQLWGANGVNVGAGQKVTILPLSTGGAIVGWLASSGAVMQKYDATGTAIWPSNQPITAGSGFAAPANFFELSGGDCIAVFHQLLSGISSYLYAQRYDSDGNPVWTNAVQIADRTTAFNRSYTGVQDGDVVYMGYFASMGTRFDSYLQRIDADGTLPWGINGSDFDTNETDYEMGTEIAFEAGSQYVWSISTYTNTNQSEAGEYVQKFDKVTGARELGDNAKVVFPIGEDKTHAGSLQLKNDTPLFLMQEGENNGVSPTTLNAVSLDSAGDFAWPEETRPVATFSAAKLRVHFTKQAASQSVAVFVENKGNGPKMYAQNVQDDTAGIEDFSNVNVFFANPVQNSMDVQTSEAVVYVSIHNVLGQIVYQSNELQSNEFTVDTSGWNSGVYVMNLQTTKGVLKGIKLIKQ